MFDHPLRSYNRYLKKYVRSNFEILKIKFNSDTKGYKKAFNALKPKHKMRVRSQQPLYRSMV